MPRPISVLRPATLMLVLLIVGVGSAAPGDKSVVLSGKEIYNKTLRSTVWIIHASELGDGRMAMQSGSGSVIDVPRKLILTNVHVVGNDNEVRVFFPQFDREKKVIANRKYYLEQFRSNGGLRGKVIARDPKRDLALIELIDRLPNGTTAIPLAKESVGPGDSVHSIGNPGASDALWAYTNGSVKQVYKKTWQVRDGAEIRNYEAQVVETTSPVNPGDSGGPMLNNACELVAVTQGGVKAAGTISYFIDISEVRALLNSKKIRIASAPTSTVLSNIEPKPEDKTPAKDPAVEQAEKEEKLAASKLVLAEQFLKDRPEKAKERLEEIIKHYPNTKAAKEAKRILATIRS